MIGKGWLVGDLLATNGGGAERICRSALMHRALVLTLIAINQRLVG